MQRRNAFTLIELLVVIAIIAILAAILFPVFAQAKLAAKKATAISQYKQTGTAILMYTGDNDDMGPCGQLPDLGSGTVVRYKNGNTGVLNPFDWTDDPGINEAEHALVWNNSTEPYRKNYQVLDYPGSKQVAGYNATVPVKTPAYANVNYNGFLQYYSFSSIAAPSILPMLWQGQGDTSRRGVALSVPMLNCNGTGVCRFNSGGPPQADMSGTNCSVTLYITGSSLTPFAGTNVYVASDSSAKSVKMGRGNQAAGLARLNSVVPWQFINENGTIDSDKLFIRGWTIPNTQYFYVAAFVPENTFQN